MLSCKASTTERAREAIGSCMGKSLRVSCGGFAMRLWGKHRNGNAMCSCVLDVEICHRFWRRLGDVHDGPIREPYSVQISSQNSVARARFRSTAAVDTICSMEP